MGEQPTAKDPVDWEQIGALLANGALTEGVPGLIKAWNSASIATHGAVHALNWDLTEDIALKVGEVLHAVEEPFLPILAAFVAPILSGLFGAEFDAGEFHRRMAKGAGNRGAQSVVDGFMRAIVGDTPAEIQPSDGGSRRIASAAVQASLETEFNALVPEVLSHLLPFEIGHWEDFTKLPEAVIRSLGVSRLVRRAIQPIVTVCCTTPATWHINKLHRPTLLGPSSLARQIARHPEQRDKWLEDLRRSGYTEDRIEALLNEQAKFRTAGDAFRLVRAGQWSDAGAIKHLLDQGFDEAGARDELLLEKLRTIESFERSMATAAVDAFVDGRIDEGTLGGFVTGTTISPQEKAQYVELAHARRLLAEKPLTPAEVERAVKAKILAYADYRAALRRDGRSEDAIDVLDLLLRDEIDKQKDAEQHRADQAAEKAAAAKVRADAAAAKKAQLDAQRALERRGNRATLERAAIRGLIPLDRVAEIYAATVDADTAGIYMALLEDDRQQYLDQQQARDEAKKRGAVRGVDVGSLDQAVTRGVLTIGEYTGRLRELGFSADDAALLAATLQAKLDDVAAAKQARDEAIAAGKVKHVSVQTIEMLVRRGHRTMADYDRTLQELGFDDGARAAMEDLLQDRIDEDAQARAAREAAAGKKDARGLTLEQLRRAVLLNLKTLDDYQRYLVDQNYTADAQIVLVDELRADVAEAEAARQRRADAESRRGQLEAPIADVARAARLGLIPVQVYADRLAHAGYGADAIDLELDLLVQEMADIAEARRARDEANTATAAAPLPLAQVERAVKAGISTLADYMAAARSAGFSDAAVDVLSRLLQQELEAAAAASARRDAIAAAAAERSLSLAQLEAAVRAGLLTLDDYAARIRGLGYGEEDAALLVTLLGRQLLVLDQARTRRAAIATGQPEAHVTLSQLEAGVKNGIISMRDYLDELRRRGYGEGTGIEFDADGRLIFSPDYDGPYDDTALLGLLLQVELDTKNAKGPNS
jgi:hypothetical protein